MAKGQDTTLELNFAPVETRLIPLRNHKREVVAHAIVDAADYEAINRRRWRQSPFGYAINTEGGRKDRRSVYMHRVIAGTPKGMHTDHINGNKLDNRRCNLRVCTGHQNHMNVPSPRTKQRGKYIGVSWDKSRGLWIAMIKHSGKQYNLGRFDSEETAALVRDRKAKEFFGEFARLNFPAGGDV